MVEPLGPPEPPPPQAASKKRSMRMGERFILIALFPDHGV